MTEPIKPFVSKGKYCDYCGRKLILVWRPVGNNKRFESAYDDETGELNYFRLRVCPKYSDKTFAVVFLNSLDHTCHWEKTIIASKVYDDQRSAT